MSWLDIKLIQETNKGVLALHCCLLNCQILQLKPIFHCDAKPLALGPGVRLDPQCHTFASPNAKYTNMLLYFGVT